MPLKRHREFARPGVFEGMNVERRGICASRSFMDQAHRSSLASAGSRNDVAPIMLPRPKEPKVFDLRSFDLPHNRFHLDDPHVLPPRFYRSVYPFNTRSTRFWVTFLCLDNVMIILSRFFAV